MYNVRRSPKTAKNVGENTSYSKAFKSHCSCPNNLQFKNNQSKGQDKTHSNNNSLRKTTQESEQFLRDELKKYGLTPKAKNTLETKHFNSPRHGGRVDINLKHVPENRIIKVNIKEIMCRNKYRSKTEPNLLTDRYVEDLKKEIKSMKREIPSLPEKYKKNYLRSLKEELYLNKLTTHHDKTKCIEDIKKEIETFRADNTSFVPDHLQIPRSKSPPTEFKITIHSNKDHKLKHPSRGHKIKVRKVKKAEGGNGYDR